MWSEHLCMYIWNSSPERERGPIIRYRESLWVLTVIQANNPNFSWRKEKKKLSYPFWPLLFHLICTFPRSDSAYVPSNSKLPYHSSTSSCQFIRTCLVNHKFLIIPTTYCIFYVRLSIKSRFMQFVTHLPSSLISP